MRSLSRRAAESFGRPAAANAVLANQLVIQSSQAEPPSITRARQFILEHRGEELSLAHVAKAVNMSSFYFCKTFKKVTGLNFTDYLARARIEKAKELLLDPNARVSEIVFEVGFQSITHFNRIFKRHVGKSPTEYRKSLPKASQRWGPALRKRRASNS
jgi:AraC-like DNA-binding protein